jgi:hypothetical protein
MINQADTNKLTSENAVQCIRAASEKPVKSILMQIRVQQNVKDKLDVLIQRFNQNSAKQTRSIQRSEVIRHALLLGMSELEKELKSKRLTSLT